MTQGRVRRAITAAAVTGAAALLFAAGASSARAQLSTITGSGFTTGINNGFGGVIGSGATLAIAQSAAGADLVTFTLTRGNANLGNAAVIYIATGNTAATGFASTASFTDAGDGLRQAISGTNGTQRTDLTFASGFTADFALAFEAGFAGIWGLRANDSHQFLTSANLNPTGNAASSTFTMDLSLATLGLAPGQSFDYVVTYLNGGDAYRSNEFQGVSSGTTLPSSDAFGNIGRSPTTLGANDFVRFNSVAAAAVPEPGALALLAAGALPAALLVRRRRRTAAR